MVSTNSTIILPSGHPDRSGASKELRLSSQITLTKKNYIIEKKFKIHLI
jgi:hypothetical protein